MSTILEISYPNSFKRFKCLGGNCEDTCCKIWDIEIDKDTFEQYSKINNTQMKQKLDENVCKSGEVVSNDLNYGVIKLKKNGKCPFLDHSNYCSIYTKLGEEYLSNICTNYPRIMNKINNKYEISLDVSCPEAARLVLDNEDGIKIENGEIKFVKYIINDEYNTNSKKYKNTAVKYLNEIRELSMEIMKNRNFNISERLLILGDFINGVEEYHINDARGLANYIEEYNIYKRARIKKQEERSINNKIEFFTSLINSTLMKDEELSKEMRSYTEQLIEGLDLLNIEQLNQISKDYTELYKEFDVKVLDKNSYIFENYLVNFMYNNVFPFSESDDPYEGYLMLLCRFLFIKFYLVGIWNNKNKISKEEIIKFIQIFARDIEHHKSFIPDLLENLEKSNRKTDFMEKFL